MTKKRDILTVIIFVAILWSGLILLIFLPKEDVSLNEKRKLMTFPKPSISKILNGSWEADFETYISDHFPERKNLAAIDSYFKYYTGRNGSNGVYKSDDGYIINTPVKCDYEKLDANISSLNTFVENTGIDTKLLVVPSTGYIMEDKLPPVHTQYKDGEIIDYIAKSIENITMIDVQNSFKENSDKAIYYKTDHHWTSLGAYMAYEVYAKQTETDVRKDFDVQAVYDFYGTTYSKSAFWNESPDTIELWKYPISVTVTIDDGVGESSYDTLFFENHLEEMDKYPVFLDGNHSFERIINNDNPDGKRVLVIKDSFAHCFVPFMIESYSQIDMVDLRYYLNNVSFLTEENCYDELLVLYGISNMCEANDLSILQ